MARNEFDYIIAGGGMAGLSLAFYLNESRLRDKKILIIDRDRKTSNDHTWCFWERENSAFEPIIFRRWKNLWFHGTENFSKLLDLGDYHYKMIRAADFYAFIFGQIAQNPNIEILQAETEVIENGSVKTTEGEFFARRYIFDSVTRKTYDDPKFQNLWQHFLGWTIKTDTAIFDGSQATLFDFRVEQKNECRFVYILPFSEREALLELTIFSAGLAEKSEYETHLRQYIAEVLKVKNFRLTAVETGVIPMSDEPHEEFPSEKIIRIGTSGGYVKPSTGYSFRRTQLRLKKLVESLEIQESGIRIQDSEFKIQKLKMTEQSSVVITWKNYLDSVLLNVLLTGKHPADDVFTHLFRDNPTERILRFLDEETTFAEDLKVMRTVPLSPFSKAALEIMLKNCLKTKRFAQNKDADSKL